jgi:SAM-dependent methyltransferase
MYRYLYERHWWWRAREASVIRELTRHLPANGRKRILDVGCGDALLFDRLERFGEVWGVEVDAEVVSAGRHRSRIELASFGPSYQPQRRFDLILMLDVLEHMADPVEALRHASALLEPGGRLLVTVPAFRLLWTSHDDLNGHVDRYTRRTLSQLVNAGGFDVEAAQYLFHWVFPAKLLAKGFEALRPTAPEPSRVPPHWLNTLLYGVSRLEYRSLAWARIPFGSSVMAWCRPRAPVKEALAVRPLPTAAQK